MKNQKLILGLMCIVGSYYFATKARNAKTRNTRIIDEITSEAFSLAANLVKG